MWLQILLFNTKWNLNNSINYQLRRLRCHILKCYIEYLYFDFKDRAEGSNHSISTKKKKNNCVVFTEIKYITQKFDPMHVPPLYIDYYCLLCIKWLYKNPQKGMYWKFFSFTYNKTISFFISWLFLTLVNYILTSTWNRKCGQKSQLISL